MVGPIDTIGLVLAIGSAAIGSYIGAATDRAQRGESNAWNWSKCASCGMVLGPRDIVPLVSYCVLGGRCRYCEVPIPKKLFVIEALAVTVTVITQAATTPELRIQATLLAWSLLALSWFDYEQGRLPNVLTIPLAGIGLGLAALGGTAFSDHLLGATLGFVMAAGVALTYRRLCGRDGLGGGDVKMLAAAGAWVGWERAPLVLFLASLSALAFCLVRGSATGNNSVRFGPFIAAAAWIVWVWRPPGMTL
jgi:leader peptidase (prepilin peptidase) / N-methyltransferase